MMSMIENFWCCNPAALKRWLIRLMKCEILDISLKSLYPPLTINDLRKIVFYVHRRWHNDSDEIINMSVNAHDVWNELTRYFHSESIWKFKTENDILTLYRRFRDKQLSTATQFLILMNNACDNRSKAALFGYTFQQPGRSHHHDQHPFAATQQPLVKLTELLNNSENYTPIETSLSNADDVVEEKDDSNNFAIDDDDSDIDD